MSDNRKLKIGQRRTEKKAYRLKKSPIKPVSDKQKKKNAEYTLLSTELRLKATHTSEYSGDKSSRSDPLICHHIEGRKGKNLLNPFNIIVTLSSEHLFDNDAIHNHNSYEMKQKLLENVKPIRLSQGYKLEDYQ